MNKKIKVMNQRPEASDEEIEGYMDFQDILHKRDEALKSLKRTSIIKKSLGLLISGMVVLSLVWYFQTGVPENIKQPEVNQPESTLTEGNKPEAPAETGVEGNDAAKKAEPLLQKKKESTVKDDEAESVVKPEEESKSVAEEKYVQAEPVQGYPELYSYFNEKLVYPKEALKDSVQGILTISFIINREGRPERIDVVNSLGESFDREAKRLIENMPDWKPATLNGSPVPSKITLPITFQIQKVKAKE